MHVVSYAEVEWLKMLDHYIEGLVDLLRTEQKAN